MLRSELRGRVAAAMHQHPWLASVLLLLCLNAGFYAWTQGALAPAVWFSALADARTETEIRPESIQLLTPDEVVQLQAQIALQEQAAQAAAQAEAKARAAEREIVLEFEPAPKLPKRALKAMQPIVKLRLKNPRGQSAP